MAEPPAAFFFHGPIVRHERADARSGSLAAATALILGVRYTPKAAAAVANRRVR